MTTRIRVRLTPRAGRDAIDGWDGDTLRARVAPPAANNRANEALVRLIAGGLRIARSRVRIASGERSRIKLLEIEGVSENAVRSRLRETAAQP